MIALRSKGPWVTASVVLLTGIVLTLGGAQLMALGGSWYYALAGAGLSVSGVQLWRGKKQGAYIYWGVLAGTLVWALFEAGLELWLLAPRIAGPTALGIWLCMPLVRSKLGFGRLSLPRLRLTGKRLQIGGAAIALAAIFGVAIFGIFFVQMGASEPMRAERAQPAEWPLTGRSLGGSRFAPLTQINRGNVAALREAWRFDTGEVNKTFQATPIQAGNLLFFCNGRNVVFALDPETGVERWRFDPKASTALHMNPVCRGVSYHQAAGASGPCSARILLATIDARLIALDAASGLRCEKFGQNGQISLMEGIGDFPAGFYYTSSPPLVVGDTAIVGAFVLDNQTLQAPSGVVRGFDARTGELRWAWDMGQPKRRGAPPKGETYTKGTPNVWSFMSADPKLGLVYLPMGNPSPDFWGMGRSAMDEKYGSAIVALDAASGVPRWSFQTVHHDLWDYDVPAQPVLIDLPANGSMRQALVQGTKQGEIFVLDRVTGEPIFPVTERPAPQKGFAPGEKLSPTQPYSSISLTPPPLTERDMWGITPIDQMLCRIEFRKLRYEGPFTPPGLTQSLKFPGAFGVMDWGGLTIDEEHNILIVNTSAVAYVDKLIARDNAPAFARRISDARSYDWGPQEGAPFVIHTHPFLSRLSVPCNAPPWGRVSAIDLRTGHRLWSRPLGDASNSGPFHRRIYLPLPMGVPNLGGGISTGGGLTFLGATVDRALRAIDTQTGKVLWLGRLPDSAHSTPITYVSASGRQFVAVPAGGHHSMGRPRSNVIVAFALPESLLGAPAQ